MQNDAIIFDVDGTLWNACSASAKGWNIGLAKLGIDKNVTPEQIESVAGNPYEKCVDILLPAERKRQPDILLDTLNACEIETVKSEGGRFYDGVIEGIKELATDYQIFLVSNCQKWYMELFLGFSGLRPYLAGFDCHGVSGQPKDQMLSNIRREHSLNNPVYIGDTAGDESAAKLGNIEFIHVSYGFGTPKGRATTFDSFTELLNYLKS